LEGIARSPNQKILMLPLEASSVIGSLAGLAEITKEAFANGAAGDPAPSARSVRQGSVPPTGPAQSGLDLLAVWGGGQHAGAFGIFLRLWRFGLGCSGPGDL